MLTTYVKLCAILLTHASVMELCTCRVRPCGAAAVSGHVDVAHSHPVIPATGLYSNMYALEKSIVIEVSYNIRDKRFVDSAWILF